MGILEVILISLLILWVVFTTMSIDNEVSGVRYELHEIQSILNYYIKEKLKEKEEREIE